MLDSIRVPDQPNWRGAIDRLAGAYADATLRGYRADFAVFERWCLANGLQPIPSNPEIVAEFIAADATSSATSTLKRRLCAIRKVHRLLRFQSPVDDEEVAIALRRAMRSKRRRPKQAMGLSAELRDRVIAACPGDTLIGLRDRVIFAVGYDTLCRRTELVNLQLEDLARQPNGAGKILVRRAKNDPFGDGRWAYISPAAMVHLDRWLDASGILNGFLLRAVIRDAVQSRSVEPVAINRRLKAMARAANLDAASITDLSGHSMRVGAAQDLMVAGRTLLQIMTAGGWTSVGVVGRYVRDANINVWTSGQDSFADSI